jgi:predicted nucleic acid-binding protein
MKIYLDVSCLNRPFDNQNQARIRFESAAVVFILEQVDAGRFEHVSSDMARLEIAAIADEDRRQRVQLLLPDAKRILKLTEETFHRAEELEDLGFKPADAVHLAAAEQAAADVFLSCDDRLCRRAKRLRTQLHVEVANPLDWSKEFADDEDA